VRIFFPKLKDWPVFSQSDFMPQFAWFLDALVALQNRPGNIKPPMPFS
jgi:hypothetical protein